MNEYKQLKASHVKTVRDLLLVKQNGICPICGLEITDPVLDHSHKKRRKGTGLIRGVICRTCNVFLAKSENNAVRYKISHERLPYVLRRMARYLLQKHYPLIHPSETVIKRLQLRSYQLLKKRYDGKGKFPLYPKNKKLNKKLASLFMKYDIVPQFYGEGKENKSE